MQNSAEHGWLVVCLCAAWCGTCRDYRATFGQVAARHPEMRFAWVDIEDRSDDLEPFGLEIENFPTVLVALGDQLRFLGTLLPQATTLERTLDAAALDPLASMTVARPDALVDCLREIGERVD